jgi:hypothetical protein
MNLGFYSFYNAYNQNRMFTASVDQQGHDWLYTSRLLGEKLRSMGHQVATVDMQPLEWFDRVFFGDYPDYYIKRNKYFHGLLRARHPDINLILGEPAVVRPDNYDTRRHKPFRRVVTYKKDLVAADPSKYVLYHYPVPPPPVVERGTKPPPFARRKLCCLIQSYMVSNYPGELFSERVRAARWFEANAPRDFDLIGPEWDRFLLPGRLSFLNFALRAVYRRVRLLDALKFRQFPSCIGPTVKSKHLTLMDYRFSIGYENAVEKDWLSEKLWDCFHASCVPVYLGAPNVTDYVPANTFIDKRNFTYPELHRYMTAMPEREYEGYLEAAASFLRSPAFHLFTSEAYVERMAQIATEPRA